MYSTKTDKDKGPHGYNAVRPPASQTPGSRAVGSSAKGGSRSEGTTGRGSFSGSPPQVGAGCDWGSPHKVGRIKSTGRGA